MISSVMSELRKNAECMIETVFRKLGDGIHDRLRNGIER